MIIGFSHHSGVGGSGPVLDYLTGYLVNGERRTVPPEVVRGDAKAVAAIIDALPFQRRYTSGVCSFAAEDRVTPEIQEDIMNRFESAAFAGIPTDRRSIVWIAHRDKGRMELHFVVPRVDLGTGKSLNIAPPTPASRRLFDTLRSGINRRYGFRDPNDPKCRQDVSLPTHVAKAAAQAKRLGQSGRVDVREVITERLLTQARDGTVKSRADVVRFLIGQGFEITRSGINYITVVCPDTGERVRLKGDLYREHFSPRDLSPETPRPNPAELLQLDRSLQTLVQARSAFHQARYAITEPTPAPPKILQEVTYDRTRNTAASDRGAHGEIPTGLQPTICGDAVRINEAPQRYSNATDGLGHAVERLGQAHRAFAQDFDQAVAECGRAGRADALLQQYEVAPPPIRRPEPELELELSR